MSPRLSDALKELRSALQDECNPHTVAVHVFINSGGYELSYKTRSPGSLKRSRVSMRNICGDLVEVS